MFYMTGGEAHSHFRMEGLLAQMSYAVPQVTGCKAEFIHFIETIDQQVALPAAQLEILKSLLNYGTPSNLSETDRLSLKLFLAIPKEGIISAWSTKATDIAKYCGVDQVKNLERGRAYYVSASEKLTWGDSQAIAEILYDPMIEILIYDFKDAAKIFSAGNHKPTKILDIESQGVLALKELFETQHFNFSEPDLNQLILEFQSLNRNPTEVEVLTVGEFYLKQKTRQLFEAPWLNPEGKKQTSLLDTIKTNLERNTRGVLSAFKDASCIFSGGESAWLLSDPNTHRYHFQQLSLPIVLNSTGQAFSSRMTANTAASRIVSFEIRDETATGRGSKTKMGGLGFFVSNLYIPGFVQEWEKLNDQQYHLHLKAHYKSIKDSALHAMLDAPTGANDFSNEYGRPTLCGFLRTFSMKQGHQNWEYSQPVMVMAGVGNILEVAVFKKPLKKGMLIGILGGPSLLGVKRRTQEVIENCLSRGDNNPIVSLKGVGQGGLSSSVPELLAADNLGGKFELRNIPRSEEGLSALELWCQEIQGRCILAIEPHNLKQFLEVCARESCPFTVIGEVIDTPEIICMDDPGGAPVFHLPLSWFLKKTFPANQFSEPDYLPSLSFDTKNKDFHTLALNILKVPAVADKSFLISIIDRSNMGLCVRDQLVGPWQVPVADCAVTANSFISYQGEALALGERPQLALLNAESAARMAVGEAITNIAAANIAALSELRLSLNWVTADQPEEFQKVFEAVQTLTQTLCPTLHIDILKTENSSTKTHIPVTTVVTAAATVMDIQNTLTPLLDLESEETQLIFIDLSGGFQRMGGSIAAYISGELGDLPPDVQDPNILKGFFNCIQQLKLDGKILSYHDRSDGGLFVTLCEMAFASHCGLHIDISELAKEDQGDMIALLFNEELGAVIQVLDESTEDVLLQLSDYGVTQCYRIGWPTQNQEIHIMFHENAIFQDNRPNLHKIWSETSYHLQALRDNPRTARKQFEQLNDIEDPGLTVQLTFDPEENPALPFINTGAQPKVAILRELGVNGHFEMAAAFQRAGFDTYDVQMNDLQQGRHTLKEFKGMAVCGGFSFGDVLGAGLGWAKRILFNADLKQQFSEFFAREDTFTLGVSNGCQMLTAIKSLMVGTELWPKFVGNYSEQFECRLCMVEVAPTNSLFFKDMEGSQLLIPVSHKEGRAAFESDEMQEKAMQNDLVCLHFVDSRGRKTKAYPFNPNGSPLGITGLTTPDGRITIMMPNPERAFRTVQYSWHPKKWKENGPFVRMFENARVWLG